MSSELGDWGPLVLGFARSVETHEFHGLLFQHVELCARRAWLHMNRIDYSHLEPRMVLGSVSHDLHKARDASVTGLMGLAPDRIDWEACHLIEVKGTAGARDAVSAQTVFYAIMLMAATGRRWTAANEIIGKKKPIPVPIDCDVLARMCDLLHRLEVLSTGETIPEAEEKPICRSCSYRFLCGVA